MQFELTIEEVNTILTGLGTQPYGIVSPLIKKIHRQADEQMQNSNASANTTTEKPADANAELTKQNA